MLLTEAETRGTDLYAPGATIALDRPDGDMRRDYGLDFTQVEVDLQLSVASTFRFVIPQAFDPEQGDFKTPYGQPLMPLLKLGRRVFIRMGYGDIASQSPIFAGYITAISTGFSEGGSPEIEVSGTDACYLLTIQTLEHRVQQDAKEPMREAVKEVTDRFGLGLKFSGTPPKNVTLDSNLQTDLDFLRKLVENFSTTQQKWEFYIRSKGMRDELVFHPRNAPDPVVATLVWGGDLISFKPEINLGNQVKKVEIHGWDEERKVPILGVAVADKGNRGEPAGGDIQTAAFGQPSVLVLKLPVKSKEEADQRAEAALAQRKNDLLKGEGETFGMPELLPDTGIALTGLGDQFSASYYVTKTVHRFDTSGYRTRFSVERAVA